MGGELASAAGIASLMCGSSTKQVLTLAKMRFRCTDPTQLSFEDLLVSPTRITPSSNALERTWHTQLGECDAFVSHSWHDDSEAKWRAIQQWRQGFVAKHGREPWIWFDKFCIDQSDIETDLRGLPVFLSGCKELLVLCGPSYLSRLWCVVELFTFAHIGGRSSRITAIPLLRQGCELEDAAAIDQVYEEFDASQCECICGSDKEKMMAIITTAFGDVASFNSMMRQLLKRCGLSLGRETDEWSSKDLEAR